MALLKLKDYIIFISVSVILFALMVVIETKNGKFSTEDFKVFYMAAKAMLSGDQVYGISFGLSTGFYKYSPFMLFIFSGYTLFSFKIAAIIHFILSSIAAIFSIIILEQFVNKYLFTNNKRRVITSFLILFSVILHVVRDLHMGNTNTIIIFIFILIIKLILESKEIAAGILFALVILLKPYFIVLTIILFLFNKKHTLISMVSAGVVFTLFTGAILGFTHSYNLHLGWFNAMLAHSDYLYSPYTITYLLDYYLGMTIPQSFTFILLGFLVLLISISFWFTSKNYNNDEKNKSLILGFFIIIALIPSVLITDVEHFIFSLPIIAILILYLKNKKNYLWIAVFVLIVFMFGGNSQDLVGKELTLKIKFWGWVGIANLIFIITLITTYILDKRTWKLNN